MVMRVDDARLGLRVFDSSSATGRRRLQFKKVVNTLSHDSGNVRAVANAVVDAISHATHDDNKATMMGDSDPTFALRRLQL